ncbi:MAG: NTP transferase domain-containing protein [Deltaproteobacteria bacterium]|nr:NTP transferase domain-containing protein [Deltaproteobacteria bacterium]
MKKIINITTAKHHLLQLVNDLEEEIIITRDGEPVAVLAPPRPAAAAGRPVLIVLGARKCSPTASEQSIAAINRAAPLFSKLIVVYSRETEELPARFRHPDLQAVATAKPEQPIVTSLKAGLTGCGPADEFFMFTFLSKPLPVQVFATLAAAIAAARRAGKGIIVPRRHGRPTHPLLFAGRYKANIMKTRKELGIPHIIRRHADDIFYQDITAAMAAAD